MDTYQGFKIVKIKFSNESTQDCQIFWKPHTVREYNVKKPGGRTLFIINIPSYVTKKALKQMMKMFGSVTNVYLQKRPSTNAPPDVIYPLIDPEKHPEGYKVGYVVFEDSTSIEKAMDFPSDTKTLLASKKVPLTTGLKKWYQEYNTSFKSEELLRKEVETIMKDYDTRKEREKQEAAAKDPDEEGWVTVKSKKKLKKPAATEGRTRKGPRRQRKKKTQLLNFYSFQKKEMNMKHLEEKRKKFEEDGRRMALLRNSRKFKPL